MVCLAPPDAIVAEIGTSLRLFGGLPRLVARLAGGLHALGYANRLGRTYAPYIVRQFRFTTDNLQQLERSLAPEDRAAFPMDVGTVDWERYVVDVHVPAVRREGGGNGNGNGNGHRNGHGSGGPVLRDPSHA